LFDAHSILSRVPRFFDGRLPDLNLGTGAGISADPALIGRLAEIVQTAAGFTAAVDGRFKGGYITRHFGRPAAAVHAVQLEMAQCIYMDEAPPWTWREDLAAQIRPVLERLLRTMLTWAGSRN